MVKNNKQDDSQISDEELIRLFIAGDDRAFETVYVRYADRLKRLIYNYVSDVDDAEDIFHEVFIRVMKHIDSFNPRLKFSSWIFQIAVNCCKNHLSRNVKKGIIESKEKYRLSTERNAGPDLEDEIIRDFELKEFNSAVDELKEKFRDVFILRFDHRMKYSDIAEVTNCSERTAKWRMKKALEHISHYLKKKGVID